MKESKEPSSKKINTYAKFTGIAFQMMAVIGLSVWGGIQIDRYISIRFPIFTVILSFSGVIIAIYLIIREVNNMNNE